MSILDDITSGDPHRIWTAAGAIRHLRDSAELHALAQRVDEIVAKTDGIPLGGALRPNASHLDFALRKLRYVRDCKDCLCGLYPLDELYDPAREQDADAVRILESRSDTAQWMEIYLCQCTVCTARYEVQEAEYHYRWWRWRRI